MKRRFLVCFLSLMIVSTLIGCAVINKAAESTETTEETIVDEEVAASIEDYELSIKTDWDSMAQITFSDSGITIDGSGCTDEDGVLYITEGGAYTLTGSSSSATILVNTDENVKLILNGVDLTSTNGPVIYGAQVKNLYIELAEGTTNTLTDSSSYTTDSSTGEVIGKGVISCEDDVIILGLGTLNINANYKHGISSDDKLYIEDGNINIITVGTDGIHANDLICIDGGQIYIEAVSDMMESELYLIINGGTITGSSDDEGIESKDSIYINGGEIDISVVDDGLNAANYIEINDGVINITSSRGDAIDCNGGYDGCITINGGEINVVGGQSPEGGLDSDNASIIVNGGTVTASGGVNSSIIQNGGEVNVTSDGTSDGGPGGQGQQGPGGGQGGVGRNGNQGEMSGDFDPSQAPENGERPDLKN